MGAKSPTKKEKEQEKKEQKASTTTTTTTRRRLAVRWGFGGAQDRGLHHPLADDRLPLPS